VFRRTG